MASEEAVDKFQGKEPRFYDIISGLFVALFLVSEIGATKIALLGQFQLPGAVIVFPISYIFGDVLTEVYGYARTRRIIWTGFISAILMSVIFLIIQYLPSAPEWEGQHAFEMILGFVPRIVVASILGYWVGEFTNSYVLAKMKILTRGKMLWSRTMGSTLVGQGFDSLIFGFTAFAGALPTTVIWGMVTDLYVFKVLYETIATPFTYAVVKFLKKNEGIDTYDFGTNFNPFKI